MFTTKKFVVTAVVLLVSLLLLVGLTQAASVPAPEATTKNITILHTNDFHGYLEGRPSGGYWWGGSAYIAGYANTVKAALGADNVALLDAGDVMQGTPISNLFDGASTIDIYNLMGYKATAVGNHEFDWDQTTLISRTTQATFPFLSANIVISGTNDPPTSLGIRPWITMTVGDVTNTTTLGVIGLTTTESPYIVKAGNIAGLQFQDPATAVLRYYDEVKAASDAVVILSHLGKDDRTSPAGIVIGDQTLARRLVEAGKPVGLIIGGHSHSVISPTLWISNTAIVQAGSRGEYVGQVDLEIDPATKTYAVTNSFLTRIRQDQVVPDPVIADRVQYYHDLVQPIIAQPVGFTNVPLVRNYNGESNLGNLVTDAMRWKYPGIDVAFTNSGGLRTDLVYPSYPYTITWGDTYNVLPFGNVVVTMTLTGSQIQELLNQAATLYKGVLPTSGATWYFHNEAGVTPRAYGIMIGGQPLSPTKRYVVATNDFLATGGDAFTTFTQGQSVSYLDDLQEVLNEYLPDTTPVSPAVEGRIVRLDKLVTFLHTNDSHGRWEGTSGGGMSRVNTLVKQERAKDPAAILLDAGDTIQGNSFAFYFKDRDPNPIIRGMNLMTYTAMALGNHDYNFGNVTLATALGQANFALLGANVTDDGRYGFIADHVKSYITTTVRGVDVAIFGLTNPRVPRYEMPTNIAGLTFSPAYTTTATLVPQLRATVNPDLLLGLTHIGLTSEADPLEGDTEIAQGIPGIDVLIGGHSHTRIDPAVIITSTTNPTGTLVAQARRYAEYLGRVVVGLVSDGMGGYRPIYREGVLLDAKAATNDAEMDAFLAPFLTEISTYNSTVIGSSPVAIDARTAFTVETNAANLQSDASMWKLAQAGVAVDAYLSGAMTNARVNAGTLTVGNMFTLMPYENSLVAYQLNGPQIKTILERSYANWYYYTYGLPPGWSRYTTCFLVPAKGGRIVYDTSRAPDGSNVRAFTINGTSVDFTNPGITYTVATVNYVGAGSCNFRDLNTGETMWPVSQLITATQLYVRESVIDYIQAQPSGVITPTVEGRITFLTRRWIFPIIWRNAGLW